MDQTPTLPSRRPSRRRASRLPVTAVLTASLLAVFAAAPVSVEAASQTMAPACSGANIRSGPSTTAPVMVSLPMSANVTTVGIVPGAAWATVCAGAKSGSTWYQVSQVNGKSVQSLYGLSYLYAAGAVLKSAPAASTTPVQAPIPAAPATIPGPPASPVSLATGTPDAYGTELMRLVNLDRSALGLPVYPIDPGLVAIARDAPFTCPTNPTLVLRGRAQDMADRAYFAHTVAGCYLPGTATPYPVLTIVRSVFGYSLARSEILHWNSYGSAPTAYALGCDINGSGCVGGTTTTPYTVALAQRSFMSSSPHRTSELAPFQRFGCGSATVAGTTTTYFACLFSDSGSSWAPASGGVPSSAPAPPAAPVPGPTVAVTPAPPAAPVTAPSPAAGQMVPACSAVNIRTGVSTSSAIATTLGPTSALTVVATVPGSRWSADCGGPTSGSSWYQVSQVNGQPVSTLFGVAALYAATGVLAPAPALAPVP